MKKIVVWLVVGIMLLGSLATVFVYADSFSTYVSGPSTIEEGDSFTVTFSFSASSPIYAINGRLNYDSSKLTLDSYSSQGSFSATVGGSIVAYTTSDVTSGNFVSVSFTATSSFADGESTTISFNGVTGSDGENDIDGSGCSITVSIPEKEKPQPEPPVVDEPDDPPSNTEKPNNNTPESTDSPKVDTPELSSDASLSELTVKDTVLSPTFSSNVFEYAVNVPFSVETLDITAIASDEKAAVDIKNNNLVADTTTNVEIVVTAEDGSAKTYSIKAFREKDPNYVASANCNLTEIKVSYGNLSPLFDTDILNYVVSVPYDLESITFDATPESPNATCNVIGESKLNAGKENSYHIVCTAEDGVTSKIYNITVISTHSYETFISKHFIDSIVDQINNNVNPIILDLSGADVQIISKNIFEALKGKDSTTLIVKTKNGTISFNSNEMIYEIKDKYYDLTMIKSSLYSDNMLPSLASYENYVFSTHHKSELPGFATFSVFTEFVKGTKVNIYIYEEEDNSYIIAAKNVEVGDGGVVAFEIDRGGDFIITTKDITSSNEYHSVNRESNKETLTQTLLYITGAVFCLLVGFAIGFTLNRSGKHAKRVKVNKKTDKDTIKPQEVEESGVESIADVFDDKMNISPDESDEDEISVENTVPEEQYFDNMDETDNVESNETELEDHVEERSSDEDNSNVNDSECIENIETENDSADKEHPKKEKKRFFGKRKNKDSFLEEDDDVAAFEAMLDELNNKK